mmetsp:Transcript_88517/g.255325  ORF Transcript_88517/g.255325 Transcript_88517/m.255325 type:complete len:277 (-) Transcript_88517:13-843(-)
MMSPVKALALFCFVSPSDLERTRLESLQQCGIHSYSQPLVYCNDFALGRTRQVVPLFSSAPGTLSDPSEDNDKSPQRSQRWLYPPFASIVDTIESHVTKDRSIMDPGLNATVYTLQDGFLPEDRSWIEFVQDDRMFARSPVLYRPEIVDNLVQFIEKIFGSNRRKGLFVKGPLGAGKSYSLINLTRYLMASGKYWVTIIPNCEEWENESDFFKFLLQSVGVDPGRCRSSQGSQGNKSHGHAIDSHKSESPAVHYIEKLFSRQCNKAGRSLVAPLSK